MRHDRWRVALIGGKINRPLIERNWPDILRIAATIAAGSVVPSQILRKLACYPRQNELATALREVGRVERTFFMIDWILDADLQRCAQIGLNKGEAHHALKRAIRASIAVAKSATGPPKASTTELPA